MGIDPERIALLPPVGEQQNDDSKASKAQTNENFTRLKNLQQLYEGGFITVTEFKERKAQLIDNITGTKSTTSSITSNRAGKRIRQEFVPPRAPNFNGVEPERATAYSYDPTTSEWHQQLVWVRIEKEHFAKGGLRKAYHLQYLGPCDPNEKSAPNALETIPSSPKPSHSSDNDSFSRHDSYVAKMSVDPYEDREVYFSDVEMQMYAREWALRFNKFDPPKHIQFIKAAVLQLTERSGSPLCGVERFIDGPYHKHNNNFGYVSEDDRNTPQAFSHFTYELSQHSLLICDIQGVGDMYTDPQVHTTDGIGFGKGNLGPRGFEKFLETHQCNAICRYFRLPSINAKLDDTGTVPQSNLIQHLTIQKYDVVQYRYHKPSKIPESALVPSKNRTRRTHTHDSMSSESSTVHKSEGCCCTII